MYLVGHITQMCVCSFPFIATCIKMMKGCIHSIKDVAVVSCLINSVGVKYIIIGVFFITPLHPA